MPTVAALDAEVTQRCGLVLSDAGLFLRALDASSPPNAITPVVRQGLRKGFKAVGATPASPLVLVDADVAALSPFALERVIDEAELFSLQQCLLGWWRVVQEEIDAVSDAPAGGWRLEQKRGVKDRVSELKAECSKPYREPSGPIVVAHRDGPIVGDWCEYPGLAGWEGFRP